MDRRNLPPMTMPMIIPMSGLFGCRGECGDRGTGWVVSIILVGVEVPVDSGAAGASVSEGGRMGGGWDLHVSSAAVRLT